MSQSEGSEDEYETPSVVAMINEAVDNSDDDEDYMPPEMEVDRYSLH